MGKLKGTIEGYKPRRGTIPDRFMKRVYYEGVLRGKESGADKQPAANLKRAGYLYLTKKGYRLTDKGLNYVEEVM
jgi:hypothetical protein